VAHAAHGNSDNEFSGGSSILFGGNSDGSDHENSEGGEIEGGWWFWQSMGWFWIFFWFVVLLLFLWLCCSFCFWSRKKRVWRLTQRKATRPTAGESEMPSASTESSMASTTAPEGGAQHRIPRVF